jgi:hypothetical protein
MASAERRNGVWEVDASPGVAGRAVCTTGWGRHLSKTKESTIACERVNHLVTAANVHGEVVGEGGRSGTNISK